MKSAYTTPNEDDVNMDNPNVDNVNATDNHIHTKQASQTP